MIHSIYYTVYVNVILLNVTSCKSARRPPEVTTPNNLFRSSLYSFSYHTTLSVWTVYQIVNTIRCRLWYEIQCDIFSVHFPYNTIQYDTIRYDTIRYDTIRYATLRYATLRYATIRYDTIRYDTIRYDTIRYDTIRYNTIQF